MNRAECKHEHFYAEVKVAGDAGGQCALVARVKCTDCNTPFEFPGAIEEITIPITPKPYRPSELANAVRKTMADYRARGLENANKRMNGNPHAKAKGVETE